MSTVKRESSERMSKETRPSKWDAPELDGGVTLAGKGKDASTPGNHRSFAYTIHSRPHTGYQTVQTSDYINNPSTNERQLVTITASQFSVKNLGVDKVNENIRKVESALRNLPYECRVLQRGEQFEIQTYLPKNITNSEKYSFEAKVLQIIKGI